jgi:hypothetical protein
MASAQSGAFRGSSVGHESIDGTLSGSVLQFNLGSELDQLHRDESWLHPTGRSSKTLVKYPDLRIVLIAMKANTRMHEHTAEGKISVYSLNGHIRLHLPEQVVDLLPGTCSSWISACPMMWRLLRTAPFCSLSRGRWKRRRMRNPRHTCEDDSPSKREIAGNRALGSCPSSQGPGAHHEHRSWAVRERGALIGKGG